MMKVTLQAEGRVLEVPEGSNLMKILQKNGVAVKSPCGGKGTCKKCKVEILDNGSPRKVLACQTMVEGDLEVLAASRENFMDRKSVIHDMEDIQTDLEIRGTIVTIPAPGLEEGSDADRLSQAAGKSLKISPGLLAGISGRIQEKTRMQLVTENSRLLDAFSEPGGLYGIAVDLGTTTMVCQLADLETGTVLGSRAASNPQGDHGADVISRIGYQSEGEEQRLELRDRVLAEMSRLIRELGEQHHVDPRRIFRVAICGNTAMEHLMIGVPAAGIARFPYSPAFRTIAPFAAAGYLPDVCPRARIHLVPNISGYVGGDTTSLILALNLDRSRSKILAVDLGTNGEVVLLVKNRLYACSTAAGPAFEGASIAFGMRAEAGAIEKFEIGDRIVYHTIGDEPAVGICGSGLIDVVAQFVIFGLIDSRGRIVSRDKVSEQKRFLADRIGSYQGMPALLVASRDEGAREDIWLTQKDIRELQLAKGALAAGIRILMSEAGIRPEELKKVLLAGAFGNYINPWNALALGLIPGVTPKQLSSAGNAAARGVLMILCSEKQRKRSRRIIDRTDVLELSVRRDFQETFMKSMGF